MPELPELEAFVRAQRERLCADPVESVPVAHFATVKTIDPPLRWLEGRRFTDVRRRAKRLVLDTGEGAALLVHLMSAGRLAVGSKRPRSAVLALRFTSGTELVMTEGGSKRRAAVWLLSPQDLERELDHVGPEPLEPAFGVGVLAEALETIPHLVHAFLRDQRAVAGIGRAYANEILHAAMLSPYARTRDLDEGDVERLHEAIVGVLAAETERLVPLSKNGLAPKSAHDFRVHNRLGEPCPRCGDRIRQISFQEHTVFYCATCQTGGRVLADRRLSRLLHE